MVTLWLHQSSALYNLGEITFGGLNFLIWQVRGRGLHKIIYNDLLYKRV